MGGAFRGAYPNGRGLLVIFAETKLPGAFIIEPKKREDKRGFFARTWCQREFEEHGLIQNWFSATCPSITIKVLCGACIPGHTL
jgi:dTDP-4-dehydrorhamnose 3,5-epimerase-like enzyme